jgi:hypothetical protein
MSLPRELVVHGTLSRPVRGDTEPWEYIGAAATPRTKFDPFARCVRPRGTPLKITHLGRKILAHVLRT